MSGSTQFDVIIIGGGVSGIGAACQLRMKMPHLSFVILESRASLGGTWDHYKYPGVRTDSDMYTMAYSFNPWRDNKTTASASSVNAYLANTANKYDIEKQVRFNERVVKASWSSASSTWTVHTEHTISGMKNDIVGSFIFMSTGYTNFNHIHNPDFKDVERFRGRVVHPQNWPSDLDHKDKEVIVIGSGATAITIVPALAQTAKHVTMLQRSPTYILQMPNIDPVAHFCATYLPFSVGNFIMRCKNIFEQQIVYIISKCCNTTLKNFLISDLKRKLPADCDVKRHFTPSYPVLTQRLCLSPDTEFTDAISKYGATVVTDTIERFNETGVVLSSGTQLDADIVVTATGFDLYALGGIEIEVDGVMVENACTSCVYKGTLLCGVPNLVVALGYLTASWTLRIDMVWSYAVRLLRYLEGRKYRSFCPRAPPADMPLRSVLSNFNSTYLNRGAGRFFRQGTSFPYAVNTNYYFDWWTFHYGALHDQWIEIK